MTSVSLDSESNEGSEVDLIGFICTSAKLDGPTKALGANSIGPRLMIESSSESGSDLEAVESVAMDPVADRRGLQANFFLMDCHNSFLFSSNLMMPSSFPFSL